VAQRRRIGETKREGAVLAKVAPSGVISLDVDNHQWATGSGMRTFLPCKYVGPRPASRMSCCSCDTEKGWDAMDVDKPGNRLHVHPRNDSGCVRRASGGC